jgi:phenylpropionate dioxygenase-like ring-hydroxylating dioxygenase large terminal subunit
MMNLFLRDRYWHLLCHRSELPQPGDFMRLQWLGDDVVAANEGDDIVVFDNVCPHRGARFFTEENGNSPITCPYHGWTYQSGQMHILCSEKFKKQELGNVQLGKLQTAWCGDFLFVAPAPLKALDAQLGDLYEKLASISMDITARSDWNSYTYECDWKLAIENGLDSLHTPFVHGNLLGVCIYQIRKITI